MFDRHADRENERRNQVATVWEDDDGAIREVTYHGIHRQAHQVVNYFEDIGV